jgi:hypothetical protein
VTYILFLKDNIGGGNGLEHYKKPVFFVMFKKMQENVQKTAMMSTKHHLKSYQPKHAKNMAKIALNIDNVYLDVPVLTSLCLVVAIPMSGS